MGNADKVSESSKPKNFQPLGSDGERTGSFRDDGPTTPFEIVYTFFFVGGIASVFVSLIVPVVSTKWGFTQPNDLLVFLVVVAIMAMAVFQLTRIYFVLHQISAMRRNKSSFLASLDRPWSDFDKLLQFALAAIIIASPKFDFLYPFFGRHDLDVIRQSNFPLAYNIEAINVVLWSGAGYCLALAVCFYILIWWDLNVFSHNIRRIGANSSTELERSAFYKFFYFSDGEIPKMDALAYFGSQKFWERATGLGFSMATLLFIGDWSYLWMFLGTICLAVFLTIVVIHRKADVNRVGHIFKKLLSDFFDVFSIFWFKSRRVLPEAQCERGDK